MARSPGFGSTARDYAPLSDSVSLRLPYTVNLATKCKSLTHYTKGTQSPRRAPTACTYTVSGSISLPSPGFFSPFPHGTGSLSVTREYLALRDGPRGFRPDFTCPAVLRILHGRLLTFAYGAITLSRSASQLILLINNFVTPQRQSYNPKVQALWFGLYRFRSPLLTVSIFLSIPVANEMFQFTTSTFNLTIYSLGDNLHNKLGSPIRKSPDQSLLTAPRSISVLVPSFIGS